MLGNFNRTVLVVATILLILGLIIIGFFIVKSIQDSEYPPVISDCPDYWNVTYDADGKVVCTSNSINTATTSNNSNNSNNRCNTYPVALFTASGSTKADILCEKNKWAKDCNIHWDGITNNSQACINTTI
jgi:hypothetical protein